MNIQPGSYAATPSSHVAGPAAPPLQPGEGRDAKGHLSDGRGVTLPTQAAQAQARTGRSAKRHHEDMAPTQESPVPEPDRKARAQSPSHPSQPLQHLQAGRAVIGHVFMHSTYATPRLDLLPYVVDEALQAALLAPLDPAQLEQAGRELAHRLGRQADTPKVREAMFSMLHRVLATTKELVSNEAARKCVAHLLRGFADERAGAPADRVQLMAQFFSHAVRRMPHPVVNFEEDLQAAIDVISLSAAGAGLPPPTLLSAMLRQALAILAGPRWECRLDPDAGTWQLLAGKLAEAGRADPGTRAALVQVLVEAGAPLDGRALGAMLAGLGETTTAQARDDLRALLRAPALSPMQQGDAAWGLACGLGAGAAGRAQPINAQAASLWVGHEHMDGRALIERLLTLAAPGGKELQVRLVRALIEGRREAGPALGDDFRAQRAHATRAGVGFDRTLTPLHRIDAGLAFAVKSVTQDCPRMQLFELLARYARATGLSASRVDRAMDTTATPDTDDPAATKLETKQPPSPRQAQRETVREQRETLREQRETLREQREALRADTLAGLKLDPTDAAQLAAFKALSVEDRIALMEAMGVSLWARDRDTLAERIADFNRAKADPALRIALLTRLFERSAAVAGAPQLRAVRQAVVEDLLALGTATLPQGVRDHLAGLYARWRQAQGVAPWLDEGRPIPADDRPAARALRNTLARELQALAAVPDLWAVAATALAPALKGHLHRSDVALAAPVPPCGDPDGDD